MFFILTMHTTFHAYRLLIVTLIGFSSTVLAQQMPDFTQTSVELTRQIKTGNRWAIRDLVTFLDKPAAQQAARTILLEHTFFTKSELDLQNASREQCLIFFYDNEKRFKYSEMLNAFYVTPIENQTIELPVETITTPNADPSVSLRFLSQKFDSLLFSKAQNVDYQQVIHDVSALDIPEAYDWLRRTLLAAPLGNENITFNLSICEGLANSPSIESLTAILTASQRGIVPPSLLTAVYLQFTNCATSPKQTKYLLDSLGSLEAVRAFGYEKLLHYKSDFYYEQVDYFGKILIEKNAPTWLQNSATRDMLATRTPRLLFYLAAQTRLKPDKSAFYTDFLTKLTKTRIKIDAPQNNTEGQKNNLSEWQKIENQKNIVRWWATHNENFEWDEGERRFVSRLELTARTEEIERLMRRLGSVNDSVAFAAFEQLTDSDPIVVAASVDRFRPLLARSYNTRLPALTTPILEQMTSLSTYCRRQGVPIKLSNNIKKLFDLLVDTINPKTRYIVENQLVEYIKITDLSAVEFYGFLHSTDVALNFSIGRILNISYEKYWKTLFNDDVQLQLYLKKTALFKKIGAEGVSVLYDKKFYRRDESVSTRLTKIAHKETDVDIQNFIKNWLNVNDLKLENNKAEDQPKDDIPSEESIESRLRHLQSDPSFSINDVNVIVMSSQFSDIYKPLVIKILRKLTPLSTVRNFKLKNWLTASKDLQSFADLEIVPKDLDRFIRIFDIDEETPMWAFINTQTARYSMEEKGSFWNAMFKVPWFGDLLYGNGIQTTQRDSIVNTLRNYLNTKELLSEFEEQNTVLHISELNNVGRKLAEKLEATLTLDVNDATKAAVQAAILARLNYEDIGIAARYFDKFSLKADGTPVTTFLQTDFGIPIFTNETKDWTQLIDNHANMNKQNFYAFYLKKFDVSFQNTEGGLDYEKIYNILKFDIAIPFTGGGSQRDYFTYGIIKLLEYEFKTSLNFPEKLNENQTLYVYNASKRANAWRQFLINKGYIKIDFTVSFNE